MAGASASSLERFEAGTKRIDPSYPHPAEGELTAQNFASALPQSLLRPEANAPTIPGSLASFEEFVKLLRVDRTAHLHRAVAEAITINETCFFRDRKPFDVLRETILPRLIGTNADRKTLRIWSAAASTGQEAYSVAMLICEHFAELDDWDVKIVGTDISGSAIQYARRGRYHRHEINRGLPARKLVKYLARDGEEWTIASRLKAMCDFQAADLCNAIPNLPCFDLVLLRNMLLYLPNEDRGGVFRNIHRQMAAGGYLVLGAAEQAEDSTSLFRAEFTNDFCFYRPVRG